MFDTGKLWKVAKEPQESAGIPKIKNSQRPNKNLKNHKESNRGLIIQCKKFCRSYTIDIYIDKLA